MKQAIKWAFFFSRGLGNRILWNIKCLIIKSKSFRPEDSVLIFSTSRSGSTWLMEMFGQLPGFITNFEPLHPIKGVAKDIYELNNIDSNEIKPYLERSKDYYKNTFKDVFTLKRYSRWTLSRNKLNNILFGKKVITKLIRANKLFIWVNDNFVLKHKPVFILRHPITTSESQIKAFADTGVNLSDHINTLMQKNDFKKHARLISELKTFVELYCFYWCISHSTIINNSVLSKKCVFVFYENLVLNPSLEFKRIVQNVGLNVNIENIELRKASSTDFKGDLKNEPTQQIEKYLPKYSAGDLGRIQRILDYFEIKIYRADCAYPVLAEKQLLLYNSMQ